MSGHREERHAGVLWRYAVEDLLVARQLLATSEVVPRAVCLHAQQAIEKALKSVLADRDVSFPRTHNLVALSALLADGGARLDKVDLAELTAWAVQSRYPGEWSEPNVQNAISAVAAAETVLVVLSGSGHRETRD